MTAPRKYDFLNCGYGFDIDISDYGFPEIAPYNGYVPDKLSRFGEKDGFDGAACFYMDDFKFERIWKFPKRYVKELAKFEQGCIGPDFSMLDDMPAPLQIFNKYRNHYMTQLFQDNGINTIPNVLWSNTLPFDISMSGYPLNSVIAVSNVGHMADERYEALFCTGLMEVITYLKPSDILIYGKITETILNLDYNGNIYNHPSITDIIYGGK